MDLANLVLVKTIKVRVLINLILSQGQVLRVQNQVLGHHAQAHQVQKLAQTQEVRAGLSKMTW
jgi:hypothetical protein